MVVVGEMVLAVAVEVLVDSALLDGLLADGAVETVEHGAVGVESVASRNIPTRRTGVGGTLGLWVMTAPATGTAARRARNAVGGLSSDSEHFINS